MDLLGFTYHTLLFITLAPVSVLNGPCKYEDPVGSAEFQACLRLGDRFLKKYTKALKRGRNGHCSHFSDFRHCMAAMLVMCPALHRSMPSDWLLVYEEFLCECDSSHRLPTDCKAVVSCFEEQYSGILGRRCDAFLRFNMKQGTQEKCHFLAENVHCKEALVTSGCGERAGLLAFYVARLTLKGHERCDIQPQKKYEGFHYDKQCPPSLVRDMNECSHKIGDVRLVFHEENDLIAAGNSQDVKGACSNYMAYQGCVNPLRSTCPTGTRMVYEFDNKLRTYLLKMAYICVTDKDSYADHIDCYQDILRNKTLIKCNHIYQSLLPMLTQITAFEFYCLPDTRNAITALEQLSLLNECYESVFTKGCGASSSRPIIDLMADAFKDPYYLRYKYRPNCAVHGITTPAPTTLSTTPVTTTTRSPPKSVDERSDDARAFSDARASNGGSKPPKRKTMTLLVSKNTGTSPKHSDLFLFYVFVLLKLLR